MQAYKPATMKNLLFILFIQFSRTFGIDYTTPSIDDLGAFAEWLISARLAPAKVHSHLYSVRTLYMWWHKPSVTSIFRSHTWALTIRGILNTTRPPKDRRTAGTIEDRFEMYAPRVSRNTDRRYWSPGFPSCRLVTKTSEYVFCRFFGIIVNINYINYFVSCELVCQGSGYCV